VYCTTEDVLDELYPSVVGAITRALADGETVQDRVTKHIVRGQDYVNAVLAPAFSVPLEEPVPSVVASITAKVAAYFVGIQVTEKDEVLADKKAIADRMLENIVKARVIPDLDTGSGAAAASGILFGSQEQRFTAAELARWNPTD
jgi:phage gp36-like protein